jgi:Tol biopolymer transport system component
MVAAARPASLPRPMRPADLASVVVVEELDVVPDGSAAVVVRRVVRRGKYESHLWLVDLAGRTRPRQLTTGRVRDSSPRVAPDGRSVAFVRADVDDEDAPNHLCRLSITTGAVRPLAGGTPGIGSIGEIAWSPDGTQLAFTAEVDPLRFVVGDRPVVGSKAPARRSSRLPRPDGWRAPTGDGTTWATAIAGRTCSSST